MDVNKPSVPLIKSICCDKLKEIKVPAILWGKKYEKNAISMFLESHKDTHPNVIVKTTGLQLSSKKSYLAASPDGLIVCDICGLGCLEAKCPYQWRDSSVQEMLNDKDCHLVTNGDIKPSHKYCAQVYLQMFVAEVSYTYMVTWINSSAVISLIQ